MKHFTPIRCNTSAAASRRMGSSFLWPQKKDRRCGTFAHIASLFDGGKHGFMKLAAESENPVAKRASSRWQSISRSDQRYVSLEELCVVSAASPVELFGEVIKVAFGAGTDVSWMLALLTLRDDDD